MKMKFPSFLSQTNYSLKLFSDEVTKSGDNECIAEKAGSCIFVEKSQTVIDSESKKVNAKGYLIIKGDIAPNVSKLCNGVVTVNRQKFSVIAVDRVRNPDGTVYSTEVFLL